jgi:hypothetical protein
MQPGRYSPADAYITDYCDSDSAWGPLLFLRPARSQRLTTLRCFVIALMPGAPFGLLGSVLYRMLSQAIGRPALPVYVFPVVMTSFYFLLCRFLLMPPWNRRAAWLAPRRNG